MESEDKDQISDGFHTFGELYRERSALTAALARTILDLMRREIRTEGYSHYDVWIGHDEQPGFDGYRTVLYLLLPTGQVSWHFSDADADEFLKMVPKRRPAKSRQYDGHDTPTKYDRVEKFARGDYD